MFLTVSGYVYCFVPNIVQSTLYSERHALFDAINKSKHTYFYKSQIYGSVSISFIGPFYLSRVVHITQKFWGDMNHTMGMYFSLHFVN